MAIKDWNDQWRIPDVNQELLVDKDAKAEQEQTPTKEITVSKKPRTGQKMAQQNKGGASKKGT
jgi:hypothetical protein